MVSSNYVNLIMNILWCGVKESRTLYVYIYIFLKSFYTQLYNIKYSYLIPIIYTQLYGFKFSYPSPPTIYTKIYGL